MKETAAKRSEEIFPSELRSFYALCLLALVVGALAVALGLWTIAGAFLAMGGEGSFGAFRFVQALAGWAAAVMGFRLVLSGAGILRGVSGILKDYQALEGSAGIEGSPGKAGEEGPALEKPGARGAPAAEPGGVPGEAVPRRGGNGGGLPSGALDALVLRMMAHYRENWKLYWKMNLITALCGWILVFLGVLVLIDGFPAWQAGGGGSPFLAGGIAIVTGAVAILASSRFRSHARSWEHRLIAAGRSGDPPEGSGEQGRP